MLVVEYAAFPGNIARPGDAVSDPQGRWRRGWDSNPREARASAGFQDRCLKPLGHLSGMFRSPRRPGRLPGGGVRHDGRLPVLCDRVQQTHALSDVRGENTLIRTGWGDRMIRIVLIDDHELVRTGFRMILS